MGWEVPAGHSGLHSRQCKLQQSRFRHGTCCKRVRPHLSLDELCFLLDPYTNGFPKGLQAKCWGAHASYGA